jgi:hypothetical protein
MSSSFGSKVGVVEMMLAACARPDAASAALMALARKKEVSDMTFSLGWE